MKRNSKEKLYVEYLFTEFSEFKLLLFHLVQYYKFSVLLTTKVLNGDSWKIKPVFNACNI